MKRIILIAAEVLYIFSPAFPAALREKKSESRIK
jgi:hypothetical protein